MATIFPFGMKLTDASGNALSGAKFRVYTANMTGPGALVNLFADAALSVAIPNPVITNADGFLTSDGSNECAVYVAAGTYDVAFLTSADVLLASVDDYVPWGAESSDIERTVTGNGRFKVTGSAGAVLLQIGDPSPDNSGGTLTIEGWASTQLDSVTVNSAATNFKGNVTVKDGKKLQGVVQTPATTFTAVSSVDIELVNNPTGVRSWLIELFDVTTTEAGGDALQGRLSYDGGSNYKAGASDYQYVTTLTIAASVTPGGSSGAAQLVLANGFETNATYEAHAQITVVTPNSGNGSTCVECNASYCDPGSTAPAFARTTAFGVGNYGRATHLRILAPSGSTITGKYRVVPQYGFGEA